MKKKVFSILLSLMMVLTMTPPMMSYAKETENNSNVIDTVKIIYSKMEEGYTLGEIKDTFRVLNDCGSIVDIKFYDASGENTLIKDLNKKLQIGEKIDAYVTLKAPRGCYYVNDGIFKGVDYNEFVDYWAYEDGKLFNELSCNYGVKAIPSFDFLGSPDENPGKYVPSDAKYLIICYPIYANQQMPKEDFTITKNGRDAQEFIDYAWNNDTSYGIPNNYSINIFRNGVTISGTNTRYQKIKCIQDVTNFTIKNLTIDISKPYFSDYSNAQPGGERIISSQLICSNKRIRGDMNIDVVGTNRLIQLLGSRTTGETPISGRNIKLRNNGKLSISFSNDETLLNKEAIQCDSLVLTDGVSLDISSKEAAVISYYDLDYDDKDINIVQNSIMIDTSGDVKLISDKDSAIKYCKSLSITNNSGNFYTSGAKAFTMPGYYSLKLGSNVEVYGSEDQNAEISNLQPVVWTKIEAGEDGDPDTYAFCINGDADKQAKTVYSICKNSSKNNGPIIPILKNYTVKFNMQGHGEAVHDKYVVSGYKIHSKPETPKADGYVFGGWYKDAACTQEWNWDTDVVTADMTLYAKWISTDVAKTSIKSLKAGKKSFTVKVKRIAGAEKYQVRYSLKKNMKSAVKKSFSVGKVTKTVKKLKAKKTYYVQVRTLKKIEGKTYYSGWSKVKKVRTK